MKSLLCFSGQIRDIDPDTFNRSLKLFTKNLSVDVAICFWDVPGKSMNHNEIHIGKSDMDVEVWIETAFRGFNIIKRKSYKEDILINYKLQYEMSESKLYSFISKHSIKQLLQIYSPILECIDIDHYDLVFRCRYDSLFVSAFEKHSVRDDEIYDINHGYAFYPDRVYDIFFYGKPHVMKIVMSTFKAAPELIDLKFDNGLDKRDACRLLYLQAIENKIKTNGSSIRYCDVYRPSEGIYRYLARINGWGLYNQDNHNISFRSLRSIGISTIEYFYLVVYSYLYKIRFKLAVIKRTLMKWLC